MEILHCLPAACHKHEFALKAVGICAYGFRNADTVDREHPRKRTDDFLLSSEIPHGFVFEPFYMLVGDFRIIREFKSSLDGDGLKRTTSEPDSNSRNCGGCYGGRLLELSDDFVDHSFHFANILYAAITHIVCALYFFNGEHGDASVGID